MEEMDTQAYPSDRDKCCFCFEPNVNLSTRTCEKVDWDNKCAPDHTFICHVVFPQQPGANIQPPKYACYSVIDGNRIYNPRDPSTNRGTGGLPNVKCSNWAALIDSPKNPTDTQLNETAQFSKLCLQLISDLQGKKADPQLNSWCQDIYMTGACAAIDFAQWSDVCAKVQGEASKRKAKPGRAPIITIYITESGLIVSPECLKILEGTEQAAVKVIKIEIDADGEVEVSECQNGTCQPRRSFDKFCMNWKSKQKIQPPEGSTNTVQNPADKIKITVSTQAHCTPCELLLKQLQTRKLPVESISNSGESTPTTRLWIGNKLIKKWDGYNYRDIRNPDQMLPNEIQAAYKALLGGSK